MDVPTRPATIDDLLEHADWLRALARRLVQDADHASDVEQETWLAALEHPPRDASKPRQWLAQVLRNVVHERRRSELARRAREASAAKREAVDGDGRTVDRAESLRALIDAVLALDEPYRSTLLLRHQDGLAIEEIARRQAVTPSTVRNRISRGVEMLRERFERKHGAAWSAVLLPLTHSPHLPAATTVAVLATLSMKKLLAAAVVVLLIGSALWSRLSDAPAAAPESIAAPLAQQSVESPTSPVAAEGSRVVAPAAESPAVPVGSARSSARGSLVAKVSWLDKSPAAGVVVSLHPWGESSPFALGVSCPTDDQGVARFDDVAAGLVIVQLDRAEGEAVQVRGGEATEVSLEIPRGFVVRGQALDEAQHPVSFARIWLSQYGNFGGVEIATADAAGRFTLRDVGEARRIAARAAGFSPSLATFVRASPGDTIDVVLELKSGGSELRGSVRAPDGSAVAGAAVLVGHESALRRQTSDGKDADCAPAQRLRSDANGEFVATGLDPERVFVQCRSRDSAPWHQDVQLEARGVTRITIELQPGAALDGIVRAVDGTPASKVQVDFGEQYGDFASSHTSSAADGSFHLEGLTPGKAIFRASADARGNARFGATLVAGETARVEVQLVTQGFVAGRVVDSDARALAGWTVVAVEENRQGLQLRNAVTDERGGFKLENWPAEANAIVVREPGRRDGPPALLVKATTVGQHDLLLTIPPENLANAFIVGRLRGPDGELVLNARFQWARCGDLHSLRMFSSEADSSTGDFRIGPMPAGRYSFLMWSDKFGGVDLPIREVLSNQTLDLGELRFAPVAHIRVKIVGPPELLDTPEARSLSVVVRRPSEKFGVGSIELDERREGRSQPLKPLTYVLTVSSQSMHGASQPIELHAGEEKQVEISVEPSTSRTLIVIWASGLPPKGQFELSVVEIGGKSLVEDTLPVTEGSRTGIWLNDLVVGTYVVDVKTSDGRSGHATFEIKDLTPLDRSVPRAAQIEVPVR